ncbi:MAG: TraB/GumN family protein [Trueperaceae bacterium]|nr:TraB/GumN family protein [Trueperaceae bacterium]
MPEALGAIDQKTEQPTRIVEQGGVRYTILGTAHVSKASADEVERLLASGQFDAVALELDPGRYAAIRDPEALAKLDLLKVIREGRGGMVAASLALGAFQQRLADQFGIEPGAEMRTAIRAADAAGLPIKLIDRDIGTTLKRVYRNIPWWQRLTLFSGLIASVVSREEIAEDDVEKLKEGDVLEATFAEFAEESRGLYDPLIAERDAYMAAKLRDLQTDDGAPTNVLVVIGAGHLKGLVEGLEHPPTRPTDEILADLDTVPPPSRWRRALPWAITALVLTGFVIGFARSPELGLALLGDWTIINGGLAALGALIALAHPLTILGVFVAAPLTSLNPTIGAGFVAAGIELWIRRPKVGDFSRLRQDVTQLRGWWQNRVAKTLLVFVLATLGSAIGTYLAGFRIIGRLVG